MEKSIVPNDLIQTQSDWKDEKPSGIEWNQVSQRFPNGKRWVKMWTDDEIGGQLRQMSTNQYTCEQLGLTFYDCNEWRSFSQH